MYTDVVIRCNFTYTCIYITQMFYYVTILHTLAEFAVSLAVYLGPRSVGRAYVCSILVAVGDFVPTGITADQFCGRRWCCGCGSRGGGSGSCRGGG